MNKRKTLVQQATSSLSEKVLSLAKRAVREAYWGFAFDNEEDANRYAVFYFKKDKPDDVVLARVEKTGQQTNTVFGKVTRHKKPEE